MGKSTLIRALTGKKIKTGRRSGVTRRISRLELNDLTIVDLPGYGFISGVPRNMQERVKDTIVQYLEENADNIGLAVHVVDANSLDEIVQRWSSRGEIPLDVELLEFLCDLNLHVVVAVNKMDKIRNEDVDHTLDVIVEHLGMLPPWRQWKDRVVPVSAKKGDVEVLKSLIWENYFSHGRERDISGGVTC